MIGMISSALASNRTLPDARPTEIDGSQVIPASTDLFWTNVGISGPRNRDCCRSHSSGSELQSACGHCLVFRCAVRKLAEYDLDIVFFLDRLEITEGLRNKRS